MSEVDMKKLCIGITGGIASGKSHVAHILSSLGYEVIDADLISKQLTQKAQPIYNNIIQVFGKEFIDESEELNRKKLAEFIFHNPEQREVLNSISHPYIINEIKRRIKISSQEILFLDIPLLYEAHLESLCDKIVCVYLNKETQIKRLMEREQISHSYAIAKINSQLSLEKKKEMADFVIDTKGSFHQTEQNVIELIKQIKELKPW